MLISHVPLLVDHLRLLHRRTGYRESADRRLHSNIPKGATEIVASSTSASMTFVCMYSLPPSSSAVSDKVFCTEMLTFNVLWVQGRKLSISTPFPRRRGKHRPLLRTSLPVARCRQSLDKWSPSRQRSAEMSAMSADIAVYA